MTAAAAASATSVSEGEHDGTKCDAKLNVPAVHGATDDDARADTDANGEAAANDGTATADDDANGAIISHGTAATIGLTANAAVGPASTALCWNWNGIIHGEEILTVRGRRTGSFKH